MGLVSLGGTGRDDISMQFAYRDFRPSWVAVKLPFQKTLALFFFHKKNKTPLNPFDKTLVLLKEYKHYHFKIMLSFTNIKIYYCKKEFIYHQMGFPTHNFIRIRKEEKKKISPYQALVLVFYGTKTSFDEFS